MEGQAPYNQTMSVKTIRQVVVCPECKGEGIIQTQKFYGHTEGYIPVNRSCPACHGRRLLKRITTVTYERI